MNQTRYSILPGSNNAPLLISRENQQLSYSPSIFVMPTQEQTLAIVEAAGDITLTVDTVAPFIGDQLSFLFNGDGPHVMSFSTGFIGPHITLISVGGGLYAGSALYTFNGTSWMLISAEPMSGSSTPPAGSDSQIQFNSSNHFGADSRMIYNQGANTLAVFSNGTVLTNKLSLESTDFHQYKISFPSGASGDINTTLPTTNGSNGNFLMTDGAGTLSWGSQAAQIVLQARVHVPAAQVNTIGSIPVQILQTSGGNPFNVLSVYVLSSVSVSYSTPVQLVLRYKDQSAGFANPIWSQGNPTDGSVLNYTTTSAPFVPVDNFTGIGTGGPLYLTTHTSTDPGIGTADLFLLITYTAGY